MRIAVCDSSLERASSMEAWVRQYCQLYGLTPSLERFSGQTELEASDAGFDAAFIGLGGERGFLAARRLRERNASCRIVLVDDTGEFAVRSVRIHCTDFLMRPLTFGKVARSMSLVMRGDR